MMIDANVYFVYQCENPKGAWQSKLEDSEILHFARNDNVYQGNWAEIINNVLLLEGGNYVGEIKS